MATTADLVPAIATWCEPAPPVVRSTWGDGLRGVFLMPVLLSPGRGVPPRPAGPARRPQITSRPPRHTPCMTQPSPTTYTFGRRSSGDLLGLSHRALAALLVVSSARSRAATVPGTQWSTKNRSYPAACRAVVRRGGEPSAAGFVAASTSEAVSPG